ncbi:hypothetical protein LEP1GSC127_0189 [Leptospira kirschneri str. 200801925]|nr:hypothetical protein LEP1GSC127_0189 [Leptospira kirschneri str. 200801925]
MSSKNNIEFKFVPFIFLILLECSTSWIRALPPNSILETNPEKIPGGTFVRNRPERSHINTLFYKNVVQEKILLNPESLTFEKSMKREVKDKNEYTTHIVSGRGKYSVSGNWVLLETYEKGVSFFREIAKRSKSNIFRLIINCCTTTILLQKPSSHYCMNLVIRKKNTDC